MHWYWSGEGTAFMYTCTTHNTNKTKVREIEKYLEKIERSKRWDLTKRRASNNGTARRKRNAEREAAEALWSVVEDSEHWEGELAAKLSQYSQGMPKEYPEDIQTDTQINQTKPNPGGASSFRQCCVVCFWRSTKVFDLQVLSPPEFDRNFVGGRRWQKKWGWRFRKVGPNVESRIICVSHGAVRVDTYWLS